MEGIVYYNPYNNLCYSGIFWDTSAGYYNCESNGVDSFGGYGRTTTGTTLNSQNNIGIPYYNVNSFLAGLDIRCEIFFAIQDTSLSRSYIGFTNSGGQALSSDSPLNNNHGFGVVIGQGLNFKITSNNGNASAYVSSDIATIDTNVHKLYLESDSANSRWGYKFDNNDIVYVSTQNPSLTTLMTLVTQIRTLQAGVSKSLRLYAGTRGIMKRRF